jgi:hypothetical protein
MVPSASTIAMRTYNLAKLRGDQPNLWPTLLLPACFLACEATPGSVSTFELSYLSPAAKDATEAESWSLYHPSDLPTAELESLAQAERAELLHIGAACVITAILRGRDDLRVRRVSRRGTGLDFYLERTDGRDAGVLVALGTAGTDTASILTEAAKLLTGAPGSQKLAGAVAFGGGKVAIRVLS